RAAQLRDRELATAEERSQIVHDLQRTVGRLLEAIEICSDDLARADRRPDTTQRARNIAALSRTALDELRQSDRVLPLLQSGKDGLETTLSHVVEGLTSQLDVATALEIRGERRALSAEVEQSLIRVV